MESEKLEYDSTLGRHMDLPEQIPTFHYAEDRVKEIRQLLTEINEPRNNKLVFQTLPKHMRRRAMSHHPKRLPRKYRHAHKAQMLKAGKPQQSKRPSRKFRRKPSNLMKEYIRRQRKHVWLETHIWHAKRFHMIEKWGYKLPLASCDKTYRACYRASAKHCLLQDVSFLACIELQGTLDCIKEKFSRLSSSKCGLSIVAKGFTTGKREGFIHLFKEDQYPRGAITKVSFIWKPPESATETTRTVWIFVHPSAYREVLEEIIKVFELIGTRNMQIIVEDDPGEGPSKEDLKRNLELKFMTKTFAYTRAPHYKNRKLGVTVVELKDTINRFRLTGPLSQSVLCQSLKCKPLTDNNPKHWFSEKMNSEKIKKSHLKQMHFWENCESLQSPGQLAASMILNLNVEDPRIHRTSKRTKAQPEKKTFDNNILYDLPDELCSSPIWDFELRNKLINEMMSTHEYSALRNKHAVVPGERCSFENNLQPIPVLLIQRPGSQNNSHKRLGYGCGWDIIIPSGYGMSFWLSFIMRGAKPGGLREWNSVNRESGQDSFLLDSVSGRLECAEKYLERRLRYFQLPPNKRQNYNKLSICSPFKIPMEQLSKEWGATKEFFILREKECLENISTAIKRSLRLPKLPDGCILQIYLKMITKGNPGNNALICVPQLQDIKRFWKNKKYRSHDPVYTEPLKPDDQADKRKTFRLKHKKLLKRLRERRVRKKRKLQETSEKRVMIQSAGTKPIIIAHFKKMCELWLPENINTVRQQCTREVCGYVNESAFTFTEATVTAVGYITAEALKQIHEICGKGEKMVLIRGTDTRHYRLASFKINCQIN